jgi:chemotaxis-related protein WspD
MNSNPPAPEVKGPAAEACWNSIGVYGNATCPDLVRQLHCRNCPAHSEAALKLLDRPLPEGYRREWSTHFSREQTRRAPAQTAAVIFRVHQEWFAISSQAFQEVAEKRPIHSLPHRRYGPVLGITTVRGEMLVCASLGHLLSLDQMPDRQVVRATYQRLLVLALEGSRIACPVDEVVGTRRLLAGELRPAPATVARARYSLTQGLLEWKGHHVGLLDAGLLLSALNANLT